MKKSMALLALAASLVPLSCSKGDSAFFGTGTEKGEPAAYEAASSGGYLPSQGGQAGVLTAGEWNDLTWWDFWGSLMEGDYKEMAGHWGFYTQNRVAVRVQDTAGNPVVGIPVQLLRGGTAVWTARTDVFGEASCWIGLYQKEEVGSTEGLALSVGSEVQEGPVLLARWNSGGEMPVNEIVVAGYEAPAARADIAFIVDATGSMSDEILFLKEDLLDILERVRQSQSGVDIRTGTVFYRDMGDDYLTRHSAFTSDFSVTLDFIRQQSANGGGDLPEAVHSALEASLQNLDWDAEARSRMAFLILDAPAHHQADVIASLHASATHYAEMGIKLIPVFCSSNDKTCEFLCRDLAIVTGGTYVFLTDDSGVGNEHVTPSVGQYEVEKLGDLLVRLIEKYLG